MNESARAEQRRIRLDRKRVGILAIVALLLSMLHGAVTIQAADAAGPCYVNHCGKLFNYGSVAILTSGGSGGFSEYIYPGQRTDPAFDYDAYRVPAGKCYTISVRGNINVKCGGSGGAWYAIGNSDVVQAYPR